MTKKLILIDGHALVHRAFHALPQTLASPTGLLTNAVYGFTAVLIKAIKDIKPDYIVADLDPRGSGNNLYPDYSRGAILAYFDYIATEKQYELIIKINDVYLYKKIQ